jgi:hypothetical protein
VGVPVAFSTINFAVLLRKVESRLKIDVIPRFTTISRSMRTISILIGLIAT